MKRLELRMIVGVRAACHRPAEGRARGCAPPCNSLRRADLAATGAAELIAAITCVCHVCAVNVGLSRPNARRRNCLPSGSRLASPEAGWLWGRASDRLLRRHAAKSRRRLARRTQMLLWNPRLIGGIA